MKAKSRLIEDLHTAIAKGLLDEAWHICIELDQRFARDWPFILDASGNPQDWTKNVRYLRDVLDFWLIEALDTNAGRPAGSGRALLAPQELEARIVALQARTGWGRRVCIEELAVELGTSSRTLYRNLCQK